MASGSLDGLQDSVRLKWVWSRPDWPAEEMVYRVSMAPLQSRPGLGGACENVVGAIQVKLSTPSVPTLAITRAMITQ